MNGVAEMTPSSVGGVEVTVGGSACSEVTVGADQHKLLAAQDERDRGGNLGGLRGLVDSILLCRLPRPFFPGYVPADIVRVRP